MRWSPWQWKLSRIHLLRINTAVSSCPSSVGFPASLPTHAPLTFYDVPKTAPPNPLRPFTNSSHYGSWATAQQFRVPLMLHSTRPGSLFLTRLVTTAPSFSSLSRSLITRMYYNPARLPHVSEICAFLILLLLQISIVSGGKYHVGCFCLIFYTAGYHYSILHYNVSVVSYCPLYHSYFRSS